MRRPMRRTPTRRSTPRRTRSRAAKQRRRTALAVPAWTGLRRTSTSASVAALPPPRSARTVEGGRTGLRLRLRLASPSRSRSLRVHVGVRLPARCAPSASLLRNDRAKAAEPCVPLVLSEADRRREADVEERRRRCRRAQVASPFDVIVGRCAPSDSLRANGKGGAPRDFIAPGERHVHPVSARTVRKRRAHRLHPVVPPFDVGVGRCAPSDALSANGGGVAVVRRPSPSTFDARA